MVKNKIMLLCLLASGALEINAQSAVVPAGGDATGPGGNAAYSIGQIAYTYESGSSGSVNQGVQQPYELLSIGISKSNDIHLSMEVYPNPSTSVVNLNVMQMDIQNLELELFDLSGRLLYSQKLSEAVTAVKMDEYSSGSYFLKVKNENENLKTFKIIKN